MCYIEQHNVFCFVLGGGGDGHAVLLTGLGIEPKPWQCETERHII